MCVCVCLRCGAEVLQSWFDGFCLGTDFNIYELDLNIDDLDLRT